MPSSATEFMPALSKHFVLFCVEKVIHPKRKSAVISLNKIVQAQKNYTNCFLESNFFTRDRELIIWRIRPFFLSKPVTVADA